jgi:hypothetical protein
MSNIPSLGASTIDSFSEAIYETNPYANYPELSTTEAELLWELAKMNQRIKDASTEFPFLTTPG